MLNIGDFGKSGPEILKLLAWEASMPDHVMHIVLGTERQEYHSVYHKYALRLSEQNHTLLMIKIQMNMISSPLWTLGSMLWNDSTVGQLCEGRNGENKEKVKSEMDFSSLAVL